MVGASFLSLFSSLSLSISLAPFTKARGAVVWYKDADKNVEWRCHGTAGAEVERARAHERERARVRERIISPRAIAQAVIIVSPFLSCTEETG